MSHVLSNMQAQRVASTTPALGDLAKKANVSDLTIRCLENGGSVNPEVSQRIADALGVSLATLGKKDF